MYSLEAVGRGVRVHVRPFSGRVRENEVASVAIIVRLEGLVRLGGIEKEKSR